MEEPSLTAEQRLKLQSAFNGANSLVLLLVFIMLALLPVLWIGDKMTGWAQIVGLILLSLFTAFILMLFLTGLIKAILKAIFRSVSPEYRALFNASEKNHSHNI